MIDSRTKEKVRCPNCGSTDIRIACGMLYECNKCKNAILIREYGLCIDESNETAGLSEHHNKL